MLPNLCQLSGSSQISSNFLSKFSGRIITQYTHAICQRVFFTLPPERRRKRVLYLETYSRRENLKFEGIPELVETTDQQNAISNEDTKKVLANFMENVLGIEDANCRGCISRMGKRGMVGNPTRTIIAGFLRFPDRERVFKCGRKLKGTDYKMFEDFPKEWQMDKLKHARKDGKRAFFLAKLSLINSTSMAYM